MPEEQWPVAVPPVDVILFEGWMLGFQHEPNPNKLLDVNLAPVNSFLKRLDVAHMRKVTFTTIGNTFPCLQLRSVGPHV